MVRGPRELCSLCAVASVFKTNHPAARAQRSYIINFFVTMNCCRVLLSYYTRFAVILYAANHQLPLNLSVFYSLKKKSGNSKRYFLLTDSGTNVGYNYNYQAIDECDQQ